MANSGPGYAAHPAHSVVVTPFKGRVVVKANGVTIADTTNALQLKEADYPPVLYIPRSDTRMASLQPTNHRTHCPFKGDASYFSIEGGVANAVWSYERPYDEVSSIREHLAFYPNRVDSIQVEPG